MRYCIDYIKTDGTEGSVTVETAAERDLKTKEMLSNSSFSYISYRAAYANGEYGKEKILKGTKYFCTADVHSFYDCLIEALDKAGFDRNNPNHVFVHCGDLLDRGPDARKCLEFVNSLPRKILIRGNHEDLLEHILFKKKYFDYYDFTNGRIDTISQISQIPYGTIDSFLQHAMIEDCKNDEALKTYLDSVIDYAEIGNHILVHGWIPISSETDEDFEINEWKTGDWEEARWLNGMKMWKDGYIPEGKTIVCGHWGTMWGHKQYHNDFSYDAFIEKGIVALDATTVLSEQINVYTFRN